MSTYFNKLPRGEEEKYIKLLNQAQPQIIKDPVLNYNYEPPIQLFVREIATKIQEQQEDKVMEVVHSYNINVDKEELIKALQYDRNQYIKGYTDAVKQMEGYRKAVTCCECKYCEVVIDSIIDEPKYFCTRMVGSMPVDPTDYCSRAKMKGAE